MIGVNLMPAQRVESRRRRRRMHAWAGACAAYALLVLGVGAFAAAGGNGIEAIRSKIAAAALRQESSKREVDAYRAQLNAKSRRLQSAMAVSGHPDWSILLDLLARQTGGDVVLEHVSLKTTTPRTGAAAAPAPRFSLVIDGVSTTQAGVSRFAMALQQTGVFETVRPEQTQSRKIGTLDAFSFELRCELSDAGSPRAGGAQ